MDSMSPELPGPGRCLARTHGRERTPKHRVVHTCRSTYRVPIHAPVSVRCSWHHFISPSHAFATGASPHCGLEEHCKIVSYCGLSLCLCVCCLCGRLHCLGTRAGLGSDSTHWGHNDFLTVQESERNRAFAFNESFNETSVVAAHAIDDSLRPQSPLPSFEARPASPAGFGEDTITRARVLASVQRSNQPASSSSEAS